MHVLIEKPITDRLEHADELIEMDRFGLSSGELKRADHFAVAVGAGSADDDGSGHGQA